MLITDPNEADESSPKTNKRLKLSSQQPNVDSSSTNNDSNTNKDNHNNNDFVNKNNFDTAALVASTAEMKRNAEAHLLSLKQRYSFISPTRDINAFLGTMQIFQKINEKK
jgi:hypothetical protein